MNADAEPPPEVKAAPRFRFRLADLLTASLVFGAQVTFVLKLVVAKPLSTDVETVLFVGVLSAITSLCAMLTTAKVVPPHEHMNWFVRASLMMTIAATLFLTLPIVFPALFVLAVLFAVAAVVLFPLTIPFILVSKFRVWRMQKAVEVYDAK